QRALLAALVACGEEVTTLRSGELAKRTGINRNTVRGVVMDLRAKLALGPDADLAAILATARARGLVEDTPTAAAD
ncbi:MAG: hypothetical protein M3Q65_09825, partial [Chloroflexota bacterium]|nr:hypothetical protein [Chloroflexota bacterium]